MLSRSTQKKLLTALRLPPDHIATLVDDEEEKELVIPAGLHILSNAELTTRDSTKYTEGKEAGVETAIKDFKKTHELDFRGKTLTDLYDHLQSLSNTDAITAERDKLQTDLNTLRLQTRLHTLIPDLTNGMNKQEALSILQSNGFDFREEEGTITAYRHGAKLKDAENNMPAADAIKTFFGSEKNWLPDPDAANIGKTGGAGSNSSTRPTPRYTRTSEVEKAFNDRYGPGASMGTEHDFAAHLQKIMKDAETSGTPLILD